MRLKNLALVSVWLTGLLLGAPSAANAGLAGPASAYNVNSDADTPDANLGNNLCADAGGHCTLRAAVMQADAHPGLDTILLPAGTFTLTILGGSEDASATGDLDLLDQMTVQGVGADASIIDATGLNDRVIQVLNASQTTLADLTVRGGSVPTTGDTVGGGVFNSGILTLTRVTRQTMAQARSTSARMAAPWTILAWRCSRAAWSSPTRPKSAPCSTTV